MLVVIATHRVLTLADFISLCRASPTSLTTVCGHSFCASCILKWYFTDYSYGIKGWKTSVKCPLCRARMRMPQNDAKSDSMTTCPIAPNRAIEGALDSIMNMLAFPIECGPSIGGKYERKSTLAGVEDLAFDWREGGSSRKEWLKRTA